MKKGSIYSLIAGFVVLMSACGAKIQPYDLASEYATSLHYIPTDEPQESEEEKGKGELVGVPALNFYGGDLKRGGIWWAGKGIMLEKGDVYTINATNIGPENTPFGATFPPLDLLVKPVRIKITARAEGLDSTVVTPPPVLYIQLGDAGGYQANAKRPFNKIENGAEFTEYFFDLKDVFNQVEPEKHKVNGAMINSIKVFINPGQEGYTGRIYIKEIKVVPGA